MINFNDLESFVDDFIAKSFEIESKIVSVKKETEEIRMEKWSDINNMFDRMGNIISKVSGESIQVRCDSLNIAFKLYSYSMREIIYCPALEFKNGVRFDRYGIRLSYNPYTDDEYFKKCQESLIRFIDNFDSVRDEFERNFKREIDSAIQEKIDIIGDDMGKAIADNIKAKGVKK